jgi:hypothetical protein
VRRGHRPGRDRRLAVRVDLRDALARLIDEAVGAIRAKILKGYAARGYASIGGVAPRVRALVPGPGWAG